MPILGARRLAIVMACLILAPLAASVAMAQLPVAVRAHPPMRFTSDLDFVLHGLPGAGTAEDPYRIEGYTILVPETPMGANMGNDPLLAPGILFQGTTAHVLVRDSIFVPEPRWAAASVGAPQPGTEPAIAMSRAQNVAIEGNHFVSVGGVSGVLYARDSALRAWDNAFVDAPTRVLDAAGGSLAFTGNDVDLRPGGGWSVLEIAATGPVLVEGNAIDGDALHGIEVSWAEGPGLVRLADNVVTGVGRGIRVGAAGPVEIEGNRVSATEFCLVTAGESVVVRDNSFDGCARGVLAGEEPGAVAQVATGNTLHGRPMLMLRDVADVDLDATGLGWIHVSDSARVRIRNLDLAASAGRIFALRVTDLAIEDSRIEGRFTMDAIGLVLRNVRMPDAHLDVQGDVVLDGVVAEGGWIILHLMGDAHALVTRSRFADSGQHGVSVAFANGCSTLRVEDSVFARNDFSGIHLADGIPPCNDLVVRNSTFTGHYYAGVWAEGAGVVDARENWWGSAAGPTPAHSDAGRDGALAEGGAVILVDPWLATPP